MCDVTGSVMVGVEYIDEIPEMMYKSCNFKSHEIFSKVLNGLRGEVRLYTMNEFLRWVLVNPRFQDMKTVGDKRFNKVVVDIRKMDENANFEDYFLGTNLRTVTSHKNTFQVLQIREPLEEWVIENFDHMTTDILDYIDGKLYYLSANGDDIDFPWLKDLQKRTHHKSKSIQPSGKLIPFNVPDVYVLFDYVDDPRSYSYPGKVQSQMVRHIGYFIPDKSMSQDALSLKMNKFSKNLTQYCWTEMTFEQLSQKGQEIPQLR